MMNPRGNVPGAEEAVAAIAHPDQSARGADPDRAVRRLFERAHLVAAGHAAALS